MSDYPYKMETRLDYLHSYCIDKVAKDILDPELQSALWDLIKIYVRHQKDITLDDTEQNILKDQPHAKIKVLAP
jgi:hypothetical protein